MSACLYNEHMPEITIHDINMKRLLKFNKIRVKLLKLWQLKVYEMIFKEFK